MMLPDLRAKPFNLSERDIKWVRDTLAGMTLEEKLGQLFCPIATYLSVDKLLDMHVGGLMYLPMEAQALRQKYVEIQSEAKIPFLLAANTEYGGIGVTTDGTHFAKPMQVAATGDEEQAYRLGLVACAETAAVGGNWSFAPVIDIDRNFLNPITNVRTYGSDPARVLRMARQFLRGAREAGIAVSIKHFPGDGADDRDQHLHITVNSLCAEEWNATYGMLYRELIAQGAQTVMVGHIAQPAWAKKLNPDLSERETYMPASLSKELLHGLLRGECGFNGMIVSDATSMLGFTNAMPRREAVPYSIMCGVDMFLFNVNLEEDYAYMLEGYRGGLLTDERLDEALTRILGLKASLGLHEKQRTGALVPDASALHTLRCEKHLQWAAECADKGITLAKDTAKLLPVTPQTHPRIALLSMESEGRAGDAGGCATALKQELERLGFRVEEPQDLNPLAPQPPRIEDMKARYDLMLYCFNLQTTSNQTSVRLNWKQYPHCIFPWFVREVPTLAVSFANPYHLYDAPEFQTYINAYTQNEYTVRAVAEKLAGLSPFKGISPVDAFCGKPECGF